MAATLGGMMVSQGQPLHSRVDLAAEPNLARWGRAHALSVLADWHVPDLTVDHAVLITSELLSNAYRHAAGSTPIPGARTGPSRCSLLLWLAGDVLTVAVHDEGRHPPVLRPVSADSESGRGLVLVDNLSDAWGYTFQPSGKLVWARLSSSASMSGARSLSGPSSLAVSA